VNSIPQKERKENRKEENYVGFSRLSVDNIIKGPWSRNKMRLHSTAGMTLAGEEGVRRKVLI
jgi:hypothetical protein